MDDNLGVQKEGGMKLDDMSAKNEPQPHNGLLGQLYSLLLPTSWKHSGGGGEGEGRAQLTPHPLAVRLATISPDQVGQVIRGATGTVQHGFSNVSIYKYYLTRLKLDIGHTFREVR